MAYKQVTFRAAAREKVLQGATALADAVRVTLGPKSKCVLIERKYGQPLVCNDGVTIARAFELRDHDRCTLRAPDMPGAGGEFIREEAGYENGSTAEA